MPRVRLCPSMQRELNVSAALKKGIVDKGWTVSHLAELLRMDKGNLSRIINHPMSVKFETICKIADKLGIRQLDIK